MPKAVSYKYILLTGLVVLAIINLTKTSIQIMHASKKLDNIDTEIKLLEQEKSELEKSIAYKKTEAYVEEKARNELNLAKPNEEMYIVSGFNNNQNQSKIVYGEKVLGVYIKKSLLTMQERKANVKVWLELFF